MGKLKTIIIDLVDPKATKEEAEKRLIESENLVQTYGGIVVIKKIQKRGMPNYRTYIGSGKADEIYNDCLATGANLVIINNILKPQQIFNLTTKFEKKKIQVWDRVDLILKIFAKHASSTEAKLQIELASIKHMGPRIFDMGLELSRQGGGIGTKGIGETNTEIMKRHLQKQEQVIKKKLKHYELIRQNHRKQRRRNNFQTIAIVGYTNAGKSTLLNTLTQKGAYTADELFATLDTRVGKLYLPESQNSVLLSDTIGFIQDMPPDLIEAFKSTLSETVEADIILHVIDTCDPEREEKIQVVEEILDQLDVSDKPKMYVFNKIDQKSRFGKTKLLKQYKDFSPVFVSAVEKEGLDDLKQEIEKKLAA